jgi:hypothetical protein
MRPEWLDWAVCIAGLFVVGWLWGMFGETLGWW